MIRRARRSHGSRPSFTVAAEVWPRGEGEAANWWDRRPLGAGCAALEPRQRSQPRPCVAAETLPTATMPSSLAEPTPTQSSRRAGAGFPICIGPLGLSAPQASGRALRLNRSACSQNNFGGPGVSACLQPFSSGPGGTRASRRSESAKSGKGACGTSLASSNQRGGRSRSKLREPRLRGACIALRDLSVHSNLGI